MKLTPLVSAVLLLAAALWFTAQNNAQQGEAPKPWPERAAERFGDNPTAEHKAEIDSNLPVPSKPAAERRILVFYRCETFIHTSIPFGNYALQSIGEKTGAFEVDLADEYEVFTKENLARYDALVFNNTTSLDPDEDQRAAILDFVHSGKGIVGIHAAADNFSKWPEGVALMGGIFNGHPWNAPGTWAFKVEDPDHTLNAAFGGEGFWMKDEIYWYKPESFQGRERLRVLLSLDMSRPENAKPLEAERWKEMVDDPAELDVPVSWCREVGEGRLFYTNLGHNDMTFANQVFLQHLVDGLQYAMGDIEAEAIPSAEVEVVIVPAPEEAP